MNKRDLVEVVAKKANLTNKAANEALASAFNAIRDSLKRGERVVVTGFGTFNIKHRAERVGRNPKTGDKIKLSARKVASFTPGKALKKSVK